MKFSENWLREWVNPDIDTNTMLAQLTMAGLEVDGMEPAAPELTGVVVGEISAISPHPDADKLQVTQVDVGAAEPIEIVCGAGNIFVGMKVPVATIGAKLPGGFKIKQTRLRGIESFGMLCSEQELGLAEETEGIMAIPEDLVNGLSLSEALKLDDNCIEIDLTPNRGDCLSIRGVAREIGVINRAEVNRMPRPKINITTDKTLKIDIQDATGCPRYSGRVIDKINPNATTPLWMQEKLRRGGIRSIHPLVDVTNFVLLELGQPMHAFDLAKIDSEIVVRKAKSNEKLTLLDGKEIELDADTLLIADKAKPLALAGVMGGEYSGISENTNALFLECAYFNPLIIAGVARKYGLNTDTSHRYERGVDFDLQQVAIERATELLLDIVGGEAGEISLTEHKDMLPELNAISLKTGNIKRLLGIEFSDEEITDIFIRLGMKVDTRDDGFIVTPPSWRFDIKLEADLIEELGRIYGYNRLPSKPISLDMHLPVDNEAKVELDTIKQYFVDRDYHEIVTYSFVDSKMLNILGIDNTGVELANPISGDMSVMRTSLMPGLLQTLKYNLNRQHKRIRLFETGLRFVASQNGLEQINTLAGIITGDRLSEQWAEKSQTVDFYDIKRDVENLNSQFEFAKAEHPALHPGQTAGIFIDNERVGIIGKLHPNSVKSMELIDNIYFFEIDFEKINKSQLVSFAPLSKFPMLRRDVAIVLDDKISANKVISMIKAKGFNFVQDVDIFDIYRGENLEENHYSMAIAIHLQHQKRTLTDDDIENTIKQIIDVLKIEFNAKLRD